MAGLFATLGKSFLSKVGEKLAQRGWEAVTGNKDPKSSLKTLKRNLKSLSYKARDIKGQIKHAEQSGKRKRKREVKNWLKEVTKIRRELRALENEVQEEGFLGRFFGEGGRVSELNTRVCELVDQSRHFGELLVARENRGELLLTTRLTGKMFKKNVKVIWKWLVNDKVKTIGIYGMGGVGKTSLAMHINNRLRNENRRVYWVTVSQVFTTNKLQSDIAKVVGLDLSDEENEYKRAARLNQALSQKKEFVLILDDVWSDIDLEKMGDPLRVDGCRLIVTTRSLEVCQRIDCEQKIEVKTLQTKESWTLFRETLGGRTTITSEVKRIAKLVAKECDGLPLGIIVLAKTMKGVTDIRVWRNVYDEICELDEMKEKVFRVLKYSFDRLNPKLQLCFLYCSLYPEDWLIKKDELVNRFISEELVDTRKSWKKQLDQGYTMLSKLVDLCLLESTTVYYSEGVKMHDLLRDMALIIARESPKYKVFAGLALKEIPNEGEWTEDVDKISLMRNEIVEIPIGMAPNCPKLATLFLNRNPLESIPESFFVKMSGLRSLDLSFTSILELPNTLSDLESLNTLLLDSCERLVSLPFLGKLKELRELNLSNTSIKEMPKGMENLINLKILLLKDADNLKLQPGDMRIKSRNLQHLEFPLEIEVPVHEIESFKQLNTFFGRFKDISDFNWFQSQNGGLISKFSCAVKNKFDICYKPDLFNNDGNCLWMDGCSLLDDFKVCSSSVIETLIIDDCEGIEGGLGRLLCPPAAMIFSSLKILCISNCHKMKKLGLTPPCLPNITRIEVSNCDEIEELIEDYEEISEPTHSLPKLKFLILEYLPKLKSICKSRIDCKSIDEIGIDTCPSVKKLGLCLHDIKIIEVGNCDEIEELIELDEEISEPTHSLPNLERLTLWDLPKLKSICKARINCESIDEIVIDRCPSVKKLGLCLHNITRIEVTNCGEIEELIELDEEISEPTHSLPKLKRLTLWDLPKLKSICKARINCESIEQIFIDTCPSVKKLGLCLHDIKIIEVRNCGEIEELIELDEEISEPTHSLPNLYVLALSNLPKLKSICKARIDCKSIARIEILGCRRVKKLPLFLPSSTDGGVINYSPPPALEKIEIQQELWESLEWDDDIGHKHLLQPFVTYSKKKKKKPLDTYSIII